LAGWRIRWRGLESKVSLSLRRLPCRAPGIVLVQIYIVLMICVDVVLRMN
jgi:IS4 transposase